MNPGRNSFYTRAGSGWPKTRSTLFSFSAVDQDPDGSGSIQRSWSVSLIRIHQIRGYGLGFLWFFLLSFSFLMFLLYTPLILANWTFCMPKILLKIPSFLLHVFTIFSWCFVLFLMKKLNKNICLLFCANWCPFRCFLGVSHVMLVPILCHVSLVLNARFVWYFAILLNWIFDTNYAISHWFVKFDFSLCLLNLIFDYYFVIFPFVC